MGRGRSKGSTKTYQSFNDFPKEQRHIVGRYVSQGVVVKPGYEVKYSVEFAGDGKSTADFFSNNSNSFDLIDKMDGAEKKDFTRWGNGDFMKGQQYGGFSKMSTKDQNATRTFDKYLDQATLKSGVEVVRRSDAQLVLGQGNKTPSLEAFKAMEGRKITSAGNMSFSAAKQGLKIDSLKNNTAQVEYKLKIPPKTKGAGMYIGDKRINKWGGKQREFMTNRDTWYTVGKTTYDKKRDVYVVELLYGGRMDHDYS